MKVKDLVLILFLISPLLLSAQFAEDIRTGRPGQAIGAYSLGSKVFQIQSGITYNAIKDGPNFKTTSYTNTNVFRLGIWEKFEVSAVVNYRIQEMETLSGNISKRGISNTQIGARYNILKANGAIPAIGIQGRLLLRAQSEDFRRENLGSTFLLAAGNRINDWMSYGSTFGISWRGNGQGPESIYAVNLSFSLSDRVGSFVEVYGGLENFTTNYDAGFSYLVNSDLQLDVSAGRQGQENVDDWFVDMGFSYRFDWR